MIDEANLDTYATRLAEMTLADTDDLFKATTVLFQAAAAILVAKIGPVEAGAMLRKVGKEMGREIVDIFGARETSQ